MYLPLHQCFYLISQPSEELKQKVTSYHLLFLTVSTHCKCSSEGNLRKTITTIPLIIRSTTTTNLLTLHPHSSKREPSRPVSTHPPPTYLPIVTIKDKSNHNSCLKIRVATYLLAAIQAEKHKRDIHSLTHERCLPFKGLINLAKFITSCRKRFFTTKYDKAKKRFSFWHRSKVTNYLSK